jgi:uncharacterized membrane protein YccC
MIPKATTRKDHHTTLAAMASGYAAGHAITTFGVPAIGAGIGIAAALAAFLLITFFFKHGDGLSPQASSRLRAAGALLLGIAAGGTSLYKLPMVDISLVLASVLLSVLFFALAHKGAAHEIH